MNRYDHRKYPPHPVFQLRERSWPDRHITRAPDWCSVDLRDGNQALPQPMSVGKKRRMFQLLVELGFKEIEIGFPAASGPDFEFTRTLIEERLVPEDVTVQVLTQAREHLVERTFEALEGIPRAVVHVYNSTSRVQREQVFRATAAQIVDIAVDGARWVQEYAARYPQTHWTFQYSPESFTGTELDFAARICNQVIDVWQPAEGQSVIINLPATVEMSTPNVFADQVEYMCRRLAQREHLRVSLHTHNDRGCAVAASELGVMAGADRVEGTLFGNGERTGNMDILTMAMNLYSRGVDPQLDFSRMQEIIDTYTWATGLSVHPRHPWAGEFVYTAFSGSHQDAIRKSLAFHRETRRRPWDVAYLPIDPRDLGRRYEEVVRLNSQSGKGGVALVLERDFGVSLPRWMHPEVSRIVQEEAERSGDEVTSVRVRELFDRHFLSVPPDWQLAGYEVHSEARFTRGLFRIRRRGGEIAISGRGQGVIEALADALAQSHGLDVQVLSLDERALSGGTRARALASVAVELNGARGVACSLDEDSSSALLQAMLSAVGGLAGEREGLRATG